MVSLAEKGQKINVHFSKGLGDFVKWVLRKTRCQHNAVNFDFC
jgi:hypothetical protein